MPWSPESNFGAITNIWWLDFHRSEFLSAQMSFDDIINELLEGGTLGTKSWILRDNPTQLQFFFNLKGKRKSFKLPSLISSRRHYPMSGSWYLQNSLTVSSSCRKDRCPQQRHRVAQLSVTLYCWSILIPVFQARSSPGSLTPLDCPEGRVLTDLFGRVLVCLRQKITTLHKAHQGPVCTYSARNCSGFS